MNLTANNPVIATHSGSHHADDVVGVAILRALHPQAQLIRTRDPQLLEQADFAVDVGGQWDAKRNRFDHHQKGFDGARPGSGVAYASAGLVWAAHGQAFIKLLEGVTDEEAAWVHQAIDEELMQHLDRADTGAAQGAPGFFGLSALLHLFNPTGLETTAVTQNLCEGDAKLGKAVQDEYRLRAFVQATDMATQLLARLVVHKVDEYRGNALVRAGERHFDGRVLVLHQANLAWEPVVCAEMPEVLFVLYPDSTDAQYQVRTVPVEPGSFTARADLPAAWAGLRDTQLAEACGVADAVFCHNGRFIGGATSLTGALDMARLALQQHQPADSPKPHSTLAKVSPK